MRTLLLNLLLITLACPTFGQNMLDQGNTWHVRENSWMNINTTRYTIEGDSLVNGQTYKKLEGYTNELSAFAYRQPTYLLRSDSLHRIYRYDDVSQGDLIFYDFSLQLGDTADFNGILTGPFQQTVDSVDQVMLANGTMAKRIIFGSFHEEWIEGVGSLFGLMEMGAITILDVGYQLVCYEENGVTIYENSNLLPCYQTNVGIEDLLADDQWSVFPNPSKESISVSGLPEGIQLDLIDPAGRLVQTWTSGANGQSYSLNEVGEGLYFLTLPEFAVSKKVLVIR